MLRANAEKMATRARAAAFREYVVTAKAEHTITAGSYVVLRLWDGTRRECKSWKHLIGEIEYAATRKANSDAYRHDALDSLRFYLGHWAWRRSQGTWQGNYEAQAKGIWRELQVNYRKGYGTKSNRAIIPGGVDC